MTEHAESRIRELEKTVNNHSKFVWVIITVAVIFGVSGGIGYTVLNSIKGELEKSGKKVVALQKQLFSTQNTLDAYVQLRKKEFDETVATETAKAGESISDVLNTSIESLDKYISMTKDDYKSSEIHARVDKLEEFKAGILYGKIKFPLLKTDKLMIGDGPENFPTITLDRDSSGDGRISVNNSKGHEVVRIAGDNKGNGYFEMSDFNGNASLILGTSTKGSASLFLHDGEKYTALTYDSIKRNDKATTTFNNLITNLNTKK